MHEFNVLDRIAFTTSNKEKLEILKQNISNKRLADLLDATYNFNRKFNIHKFIMSSPQVCEIDKHEDFIKLLNTLENRVLTGNAAKVAVENFFSKCNEQEQKWYSRVLHKDLKIGISVKTVVKAGFDIPVFELMLATDGQKCKQINSILSKGVYVSPKLDGYRCLAVCAGGSVTLYSRKGTEYLNFPGVEEDLKHSFSCDVVLDGEIMSDDFQAMQKSAFANTRGTVVGDVKFHVFDFIPYNEWISGNFKMSKSDRLTLLEKMNKVLKHKKSIELVEQNKANTIEEIQGSQLKFEQQGYEGAMVIPADSTYYKGRKSNKLLKFKSMQSQDCVVTNFYEGTVGTRNEGRLGGLILKQENNKICECGTGFTDEDREYIYNNKSEFIGKVAEIKYQELTKDGIMRFPVFVRWRNDK